MTFLDADDVLEIHAAQLAEHGGSEGLRDRGLLESAIAQPTASFGGEFLHQDIFEIAAALHFSLVSNHPFVDGNKRTALVAMLTSWTPTAIPFCSPSTCSWTSRSRSHRAQ